MIPQNARRFQPVEIDTSVGRLIRLKKSVMTTARLISDRVKVPANNPNGWRYSARMITLTYRDGVEWKPEHVSKFLDTLQHWAKRQCGVTLPYVWVMELTKRGRPHFHILVWAPSRFQIPKPDKRGWWPHGSRSAGSRVELVKRSAVAYVAKYASKGGDEMALFPKGARIFGTGGLLKSERRVVAWWNLPAFLREGEEGSVSYKRGLGGGWINRDNGERRYSDFRAKWIGGKWVRVDIDKRTAEQKAFQREWSIRLAEAREAVKRRLGHVARDTRETWLKMIEEFRDRMSRDCFSLFDWVAAAKEINLTAYWNLFEAAERGNFEPAAIRSI